ncbi:MAG TPA: ATP-binding protein [Acidimicrobiia bacterium]|nr:ATP-binding protein [Acidimicrobiia bacterium]
MTSAGLGKPARDDAAAFRALFTRAATGIVELDVHGRIRRANPRLAAMLGRTAGDLEGRRLTELAGAVHARRLEDEIDRLVADGPGSFDTELRLSRPDGTPVWADVSLVYVRGSDGEPPGLVGLLKDVTVTKRLELERQHGAKMEAVGRLAAGIAHELNTPIQFIGDNVHFLDEACRNLVTLADRLAALCEHGVELRAAQQDADVDYLRDEVPRAVEQTLDGVERVARIVKAMKAFGHPEAQEQKAYDVNRAIESALTVAHNQVKYVADVETDLGDLPLVRCYPGDVNQALLNLIVNAAEAVEERVAHDGGRGRVAVRTFVDGDDAVIEVSDDGPGVPSALRSRIFEPFFTTKEIGKGTGQGLALVHGVVAENHGGSVDVRSTPGHGATFVVRLPVAGLPTTAVAP